MIEHDAALAGGDDRRLAALHRATLPTSVMARLGPRVLARYYRWVAASPRERLFVIRDGAEIQGAAVVSDAPESLVRRFAARHAGGFAAAVVAGVATDAAFRRELGAYVREAMSTREEAPQMPELTQIFVAPEDRRRAHATAMIDRVEADLRRRGISRYCARTIVEDNEPTLAFYDRRGFTRAGEVTFCGRQYVLLTKSLAEGRARP